MPAALHPAHGTLIVNMHSGDRPGLGAALLQRLRGEPGLLFEPSSAEGREVLRVARLYRCAHSSYIPCQLSMLCVRAMRRARAQLGIRRDALGGLAYVAGANKQFNAAVVVSRGMHGVRDGAGSAAGKLAAWAGAVGSRAAYPFNAGFRAGLSYLAV